MTGWHNNIKDNKRKSVKKIYQNRDRARGGGGSACVQKGNITGRSRESLKSQQLRLKRRQEKGKEGRRREIWDPYEQEQDSKFGRYLLRGKVILLVVI